MVHQFGDVYPKEFKLVKGEYIVRLQLRHSSLQILDKLKQQCLLVDYKLSEPKSLELFASLPELVRKDRKQVSFRGYTLKPGQNGVFFASTAVEVKGAAAGDLLVGQLKFFADTVGHGHQ